MKLALVMVFAATIRLQFDADRAIMTVAQLDVEGCFVEYLRSNAKLLALGDGAAGTDQAH